MDKFTKEQALVVMGYTGCTTLPFNVFHEDVEKRMGHPVFAHEFGSNFEEVQSLYREDFIKLCGG